MPLKKNRVSTVPRPQPEVQLKQSAVAPSRRSWEAWTDQENSSFFLALTKYGRSWGTIAGEVGTKRQEQVRTYYYRVLRKISRLVAQVNYTFDSRDRIATMIAMVSFWESKNQTQFDENSIEFAEAIRERIVRQQKEMELLRSKALPCPQTMIVQLVPRYEEVGTVLISHGYNPRLQLTMKAKKSIASVVDHVTRKWVDSASGSSLAPFPIRLFPAQQLIAPQQLLASTAADEQQEPQQATAPMDRQFAIVATQAARGWGLEDADTSVLNIFHALGCPPAVRLEYCWPELAPVFDSASANGFEVEDISQQQVSSEPVPAVSEAPTMYSNNAWMLSTSGGEEDYADDAHSHTSEIEEEPLDPPPFLVQVDNIVADTDNGGALPTPVAVAEVGADMNVLDEDSDALANVPINVVPLNMSGDSLIINPTAETVGTGGNVFNLESSVDFFGGAAEDEQPAVPYTTTDVDMTDDFASTTTTAATSTTSLTTSTGSIRTPPPKRLRVARSTPTISSSSATFL